MRGFLAEGSRLLERVLGRDSEPTPARVESLNGAAALASNAGDPVAAAGWAAQALELSHSLGDEWNAANATLLLGAAAVEAGELDRARSLLQESNRRFVELGDEHYSLLSARLLAWACYESGDRDRARSLHEGVVQKARSVGNERMAATSLGALAEYALLEGRVDEAAGPLMEALAIDDRLGDRLEVAVTFSRLAYLRALEGDVRTAAAFVAASERIHGDVGARVATWVAELHDRSRAIAQTALDDRELAEAAEQGRALTLDDAVALARNLLADSSSRSGLSST
jgi:non-specific serine/threonine protein kinase